MSAHGACSIVKSEGLILLFTTFGDRLLGNIIIYNLDMHIPKKACKAAASWVADPSHSIWDRTDWLGYCSAPLHLLAS
jgi:hypothetical protein